jgi:hypothetical protein
MAHTMEHQASVHRQQMKETEVSHFRSKSTASCALPSDSAKEVIDNCKEYRTGGMLYACLCCIENVMLLRTERVRGSVFVVGKYGYEAGGDTVTLQLAVELRWGRTR